MTDRDQTDRWHLSPGPHRPVWEPVRLGDFSGDRLEALRNLREELRVEFAGDDMTDERLALHAIIEILFTQTTVMASSASAELARLATQRLPRPPSRRGRRKLTDERRAHLTLVMGQMWQVFTAPHYPLDPPATPAQSEA